MSDKYKQDVLKTILSHLEPMPDMLAAWEGGSAATKTKDQYSDIDLCLLATAPLQDVLDCVEKSLHSFHVTDVWKQTKSGWGEGMLQRFLMLKDAPKHFFVDVAVFDLSAVKLMNDFLEVERHGDVIVHFDKNNLIKPGYTDADALFKRQQVRLNEIAQSFPFYKTLVLKEIDRGQAIDAMSFYQTGMLRPLVEVLGMIHRPYKFDFGLRYVHKHFPADVQKMVQDLTYVSDLADLSKKVIKLEEVFTEALKKAQAKKSLT
ncbi:hypothetical protein [Pseudobdellovibrio sp. HCB154]|uniref:hypothetical protein n=1 Tax=Pseudobdellovibrio sp. HCB154 TaxID=3386277 RepID=UPI003916FA72